MVHTVNSLIFRSKYYPYYINIWNNFFNTYNNLVNFLNFKEFIKNNNIMNNIIHIQTKNYKKYCIFNLILYSKTNYITNKSNINSYLLNFLRLNYSKNLKVCFNFLNLKYPLLSTNFILKYLSSKIINSKISLRKIIPHLAILLNNKYKIKGFKCIISGRINGVQMARVETFKFYETSSQDKITYVKYSFISVPTKYGLLGIKLWLFINLKI